MSGARSKLWLLPAAVAASLFFAIVALSILASMDRQAAAEKQRQDAIGALEMEQQRAAEFRVTAEAKIAALELKVDQARQEVTRLTDGLAAQIHTHNTESLNQLQTILDYLARRTGSPAPRLTTTAKPPAAPKPAAPATTPTTVAKIPQSSPPNTTTTTTCPKRGKSEKCR